MIAVDSWLVCYTGGALQDGVNWLGFLNKYKLHGILCDDIHLVEVDWFRFNVLCVQLDS